jgi:hypothetical protein
MLAAPKPLPRANLNEPFGTAEQLPQAAVPRTVAVDVAREAMRVGNLYGHVRTVEGCWSEEIDERFADFMGEYAAPQPQASLNEPFGNSEGLPQAEPPFTVSELMHVALAAVHSFARPENWNDPEDPEQAEAWTLVDAALLAYKKAMEAAPQPQASAEDVARIDDFLNNMYGINPAGVEWADEAWQRIRASLGAGRE